MYKIYKTGQEFLDDNLNIIRNDSIGTTFFELDAKLIGQCDANSWAVRVEASGETLRAVRVDGLPLLIYGIERCARELAAVVAENKLQFVKVLGYYELLNTFLTSYEQLAGGNHTVNLSMDIMRCEKVVPCDTSRVEKATEKDVEEITGLVVDFTFDALGEKPEWGKVFESVSRKINSYALLRLDGHIVSIAASYDEGNGLTRLADVYTKPEHRNKGYSKKVVTYLTQQAIAGNNLPYLHVDKNNPVSNHLYLKIGYMYGKSRYEMEYRKTK